MKRASYRHAVEFIALNDEAAELDPEVVSSLASVVLVSEIFDVTQERVAGDVVRFRLREASAANAVAGRLYCAACGKPLCMDH